MHEVIIFIPVLALGLIIGSFLNVVIVRVPLEESIVFPGSHCPNCKSRISFYDNIPVLSYLVLKGRCRNCKEHISIKYPSIELINAIGYLVIVHSFGMNITSLIYSLFFSALVVVTFIDLEHMIIPDSITLPGIVIGVICNLTILPYGLYPSLMGIVLGGGFFCLASLLSRGGMGGGDIKLIAMIGAFLGWQRVLLVIMISATLGSIIGISLMLIKKKDRKYAIPYGPFLAFAAIISILRGQELLDWYTGFLG